MPEINGTQKFVAGLVGLAMFMLAVYMAIVGPLNQRIDFVMSQVARVEDSVKTHEAGKGHPELTSEVAAIGEKFTEVEAQFDGDRNLNNANYEHLMQLVERQHEAEKGRGQAVAAQWERIRALERKVFGASASRVRQ